jgi:PKD domain
MRRCYFFILSTVLVLAFTQYAHAQWVTETIASEGQQGEYSSIVLDSTDTPHAAWYDRANARLMYGKRLIDGWDIAVVDEGNRGRYAHIALNPITDLPAVAYYDDVDENAMYAWFDDTGWHNEEVEDTSDNQGEWIDLAFNNNGVPYTSFHFDEEDFLSELGLMVCFKDVDTWNCTEVDDRTQGLGVFALGTHTAIAFNGYNQPQIAYQDELDTRLKFAWNSGTSWTTDHVADFADLCGSYNGIAVDDGNNVYISTYDESTFGDNCASVFKKIGGVWSKEQIECGSSSTGRYTDIAVGDDGVLQVVYYAGGQLRYAEDSGSTWGLYTLDVEPSYWSNIALDSAGNPHVVYYSSIEMDLRYTRLLGPPSVTTATPDNGVNTEPTGLIIIEGAGFTSDSEVALFNADTNDQIQGTSIDVLSQTTLNCVFDLTGEWPGSWDVRVSNPAGMGVLENGFQITTAAPEPASMDPAIGQNDNPAFVATLTGTYFADPMTAKLIGPGRAQIVATSVTLNSLSEAEATFNLKNKSIGTYDLLLEHEFGNNTLDDAFTIECGQPASDFNANPTTGAAPLAVNFSDQSIVYADCGVTEYRWTFGDGETSSEAGPQHVYEEVGVYAVSLQITTGGGSSMETKTDFITVTDGPVDDDADDDTDDDDDWIPDDDANDDDGLSLGDDDTEEADSGDDDNDDDSGCCGC